MVFRLAVGVGAARQCLARIDARALDAGQLSIALTVAAAFWRARFGLAGLAARLVGIAELSGGATALEAAVLVDALSARSARVVAALVDVGAAQDGVARVARFAHAFRRVGRSTLAVDAAREALTRALAPVAVLRVGVEGWWADALARLHALFIGRTLAVGNAALLRRRAAALVRVASQAFRTDAVEASGSV